jgi:CRP/FNR family cyclic AMP-dependent transcriptional regulator
MSSILLKSTSLARLIRRELLNLDGVSKVQPCRRFQLLFSVGEPADRVYYLDSGLVKIFNQGQDGRQIILTLVYPGEVFGEHSLLANARRTTSAEVMESGSIYCIPKAVFQQFAESHAEVWLLLSELLLTHQKFLLEKIEMITMRSVEERILFYLNQLAESFGIPEEDGSGTLIRMSQSELAGLIGATRETTSSTLNQLSRRNLIALKRRQIVLLNRPESLAASVVDVTEAPVAAVPAAIATVTEG